MNPTLEEIQSLRRKFHDANNDAAAWMLSALIELCYLGGNDSNVQIDVDRAFVSRKRSPLLSDAALNS
jgi:hypothetical protein